MQHRFPLPGKFSLAAALALSLLVAPPALAQGLAPVTPPVAQAPADEAPALELSAERIEHDEATHTLVASGKLVITYGDVRATADELRFDTETRQGRLSGHVVVTSPQYDLTAEAAHFDLLARRAELVDFAGRWLGRAQFAGERLEVTEAAVTLRNGFVTPCQSPEPDLRLGARMIRYYPQAERLNLAAEEVSLQVWDKTLVTLPSFSSTLGEEKEVWRSDFIPVFGFDAYMGFLTSTRIDFSFGEDSRGTIPITFSTGRGWSAAVEHFLAVGPGELQNTAVYETPWAVSRGGLRSLNAYRMSTRDGSRWEAAADYRADINGQPVSRLPELSWLPPALRLRGLLTIHNELRAGYLLEESTEVKSPKLRWAAPFSSVVWEPLPVWQTWVTGLPFVHRYADSHYAGMSVAWWHRQPLLPDLSFNQMLEVQRIGGETPFVHDRVYDTERIRLGLDKGWGPRFSTSAAFSWSRINQRGDLTLEDLALTGTYRWNCFSISTTLRPLILGFETQFHLLNF